MKSKIQKHSKYRFSQHHRWSKSSAVQGKPRLRERKSKPVSQSTKSLNIGDRFIQVLTTLGKRATLFSCPVTKALPRIPEDELQALVQVLEGVDSLILTKLPTTMFTCSICNVRFQDQKYLWRHLQMSTCVDHKALVTTTLMPCLVCDRSYTNLERHVKRTHRELYMANEEFHIDHSKLKYGQRPVTYDFC